MFPVSAWEHAQTGNTVSVPDSYNKFWFTEERSCLSLTAHSALQSFCTLNVNKPCLTFFILREFHQHERVVFDMKQGQTLSLNRINVSHRCLLPRKHIRRGANTCITGMKHDSRCFVALLVFVTHVQRWVCVCVCVCVVNLSYYKEVKAACRRWGLMKTIISHISVI